MAVKVGINGFGRIGRLVFRALVEQGLLGKTLDVVAVNDLVPADNLAYLLKYDSTQGRFNGTVDQREVVSPAGRGRHAGRQRPQDQVPGRQGRPGRAAVEAARRRVRDRIAPACSPRPRRPRATSPPAPRRSSSPPRPRARTSPSSWASTTRSTTPAKHHIISNASCTTNCLAPVVHVLLKEGFGIEEGLMTTVHSYTATQKTVDGPSKKDWKGGRAAAINIIPSTTGAAKAVGLAIPEVKGKLTGMSFRVPTPTVSVVDLTVQDRQGDELQGHLRRDEEGQRDVPQGHPRLHRRRGRLQRLHPRRRTRASSTPARGIELNSRFFKLVSWYDNEWGYSQPLRRSAAVHDREGVSQLG